ncbi:MAG: tetratricopeptide repeat protein [Deltaproteobacteria bacterium]
MAQEEATKVSKRAQRRAADESDSERPEEGESVAEAGGEAEDAASQKPSAPPAVPPNRQARRTAAAKARADRKRERVETAAIGLDAGEMVDDALVRATDKISRLGRRHWNSIQWVIGLGLIGGLGYQVFTWYTRGVDARTTDALFEGVLAEHGTIGDPKDQGKPNSNGVIEPTPIFETEAARQAAALAAYQKAAEERPGSPTEGFARLGEAGVQLELGKTEEAIAIYDRVAASKAAQAYADLRAGALEGRGLALESKGDVAGARRAFEELGALGGFENQALYQQARIAQAAGDLPAAKAALIKLFKALGSPKAASLGGLPERPDFLRERATQLAGVLDPLEKDVQVPKPPLGNDAVQQMLKQLEEQGVVTPPAAPSQ